MTERSKSSVAGSWREPNDEIADYCLVKIKELNQQRLKRRVIPHLSASVAFIIFSALMTLNLGFLLPAAIIYFPWAVYSFLVINEDDTLSVQPVIVLLADILIPSLIGWAVIDNNYFWVPLALAPLFFAETRMIFGKYFILQHQIQNRSFRIQEVTVSELKSNTVRSAKYRGGITNYTLILKLKDDKYAPLSVSVDLISLRNTTDKEQGYLILTEKDFNRIEKDTNLKKLIESRGFYL